MIKEEALKMLLDPGLVKGINEITSIEPSFEKLLTAVVDRQIRGGQTIDAEMPVVEASPDEDEKEDAIQRIIRAQDKYMHHLNVLYQKMIYEITDIADAVEQVVDAIPGAAGTNLDAYPIQTYVDKVTDLFEADQDLRNAFSDMRYSAEEIAMQKDTLETIYKASGELIAGNEARYDLEVETRSRYNDEVLKIIKAMSGLYSVDNLGDTVNKAEGLEPNSSSIAWATSMILTIGDIALCLHKIAELEAGLLAIEQVTGHGMAQQAFDEIFGLLVEADEKLFPANKKATVVAGQETVAIDAYITRAKALRALGSPETTREMNQKFTEMLRDTQQRT